MQELIVTPKCWFIKTLRGKITHISEIKYGGSPLLYSMCGIWTRRGENWGEAWTTLQNYAIPCKRCWERGSRKGYVNPL